MPEAIRCFKTGGPCTVDVQEKPRSVFVIMPFAEAFDDVYELGIKAGVETLGWECQRADEIIHNRDILCKVCQGIRQARFVIADLTSQNANVFYELGMAHALEKDVILLAQDVGDVPFDLRQMNIIVYNPTQSQPLRQKLIQTLATLMMEERPLVAEEEEPRPGVHAKVRDVKDSTVVTAGRDAHVGEGVEPPASTQRYADLRFWDEVALGQPKPLRVTITLVAPMAGAEPLELTVPPDGCPIKVDVLIRVDESDFDIRGPAMLSIKVPKDADSEPLVFTLVPQSLGPKTVAVEFFQNGAYMGRAEVSTTVVGAPERASAASVRQSLALGGDLLPADLTMRIIGRELGQDRMQYCFELLAPDPGLGLYYFNAGMITLEEPPAHTLEKVFEEMNQIAGGDLGYSPEVLEKRLARLGNKYYDDLFPPKLRELYWSTIRGRVNTLQIISDEPWIPWEIVKPYREIAEGNYEEDDFLCQQFSLARWLNRDVFHAPPLSLKLSTLSVVAPSSNLPSVAEEVEALESLPGVTVKLIQPDLAGVYSLLEGGDSDGLHFASHNIYDRDNPDQSAIALERRQRFRPSDVAGPALRFGREKPIVFLNACETARGEAALTGLGGWVRAFLGAKASCFVGSNWEVGDHTARVFSESFYRALLAGETVGDALRVARDAIRHTGSATWLAYSLYAHPMARLSYNNMGSMYKDEGKWDKAIDYYQRSLAIGEK